MFLFWLVGCSFHYTKSKQELPSFAGCKCLVKSLGSLSKSTGENRNSGWMFCILICSEKQL